MSPTTVTGAAMCTTLLSFIKSSFVLAQMASTTDSANSSFLYNRSIHSSKSTLAELQFQYGIYTMCLEKVPGRPGIIIRLGGSGGECVHLKQENHSKRQ